MGAGGQLEPCRRRDCLSRVTIKGPAPRAAGFRVNEPGAVTVADGRPGHCSLTASEFRDRSSHDFKPASKFFATGPASANLAGP